MGRCAVVCTKRHFFSTATCGVKAAFGFSAPRFAHSFANTADIFRSFANTANIDGSQDLPGSLPSLRIASLSFSAEQRNRKAHPKIRSDFHRPPRLLQIAANEKKALRLFLPIYRTQHILRCRGSPFAEVAAILTQPLRQQMHRPPKSPREGRFLRKDRDDFCKRHRAAFGSAARLCFVAANNHRARTQRATTAIWMRSMPIYRNVRLVYANGSVANNKSWDVVLWMHG